MWTRFMDMHSGGNQKLAWDYIYIEAPQAEAERIFYNRFHHNPNRVTCTCCGEDYSISSEATLDQLTGYDRGCGYGYTDKDGKERTQEEWCALTFKEREKSGWKGAYVERASTSDYSLNPYQTLDEYRARTDVCFIPETDIKPEERGNDSDEIPEEGYVWR